MLRLVKVPTTKSSAVVFSKFSFRFPASHGVSKLDDGSSVFSATCTSILRRWLTPSLAVVVKKRAQMYHGGGRFEGLLKEREHEEESKEERERVTYISTKI